MCHGDDGENGLCIVWVRASGLQAAPALSGCSCNCWSMMQVIATIIKNSSGMILCTGDQGLIQSTHFVAKMIKQSLY